MFTVTVDTLFFTAATVLGFTVAVIAPTTAFRMMMFLMIMVFMVSHSVPLRAVNEVHWGDSTPWSQLQSQAGDENYC
jgi:hypothetical protein